MTEDFYRFEFKYNIDPVKARSIEAEVKNFGMKPDSYATSGGYFVTSLYFDSHDLSDYYDKAGGFLNRKKTRARIYEPYLKESEKVWLEVKKKCDMKIHKKRVSLTVDEWRAFLIKGPCACSNIPKEIMWHFSCAPLKPSAFVRYRRKPYILDDLRITFDNNLETCQNNSLDYTKFMTPVQNNGVIMEIKFSLILPFWFKNILRKYNINRDAFSKYSNSIDTIYQYNPLAK